MRHLLLALTSLGMAAVLAPSLQAQEKIFLRGKAGFDKKTIKQETARGLVVLGAKKPIPAEDIVDIEYELLPIDIRTGVYRTARKEEDASNNPKLSEAERKANLGKALEGYQAALKGLQAGQIYAGRNLEYKIAVLMARQAQEEERAPDQAIAKLSDFKSKHADSWQITSCLKLLARLQLEKKQYAEAEQTYKELAQANVSDVVRQEAELSAAQVSLRAGKHELARKKLQELIAKLPKDSPFIARAQIAQAECLVAAKKPDEARKILKQIVKETGDKGLKAAAYNALGESYAKAGMLKEARWEFLWVDVVYNQDRNEHARALYYLWWIFSQLNEPERAQECLDALLNDSQFNGLEYQRLAREKKAPTS